MDDIAFEEDTSLDYKRPVARPKNKSGMTLMTRISLKLGLARTEQEAQSALLIVALILIIAAIIYYILGGAPHNAPATPQQIQQSLSPSGK